MNPKTPAAESTTAAATDTGGTEAFAELGAGGTLYLDYSDLSWVRAHARPAPDYLVDLFQRHDVVILGEFHHIREHKELVVDLLPRLGVEVVGVAVEAQGQLAEPVVLGDAAVDDRVARAVLHRHHLLPPEGDLFAASQHQWWLELPVTRVERVRIQSDLETLVFALTDIAYRTGHPMADILASSAKSTRTAARVIWPAWQ